MSNQNKNIINFNAGPAMVPKAVLEQARDELVYYHNTGISVMEMSHRSKDFEDIIFGAEKLLRELMNIPDNYRVLFMHGSGTGQFASIPLNLGGGVLGEGVVNYVITGTWSEKAAKEAEKYLKVNRVNPKRDEFTYIPDKSTWKIDPKGKYLFYTDNETIHGIEYPHQVLPPVEGMSVIVDQTSNFLSRPVDVSKYGAILAATQKNAGISGLGIVIVREDLLGKAMTVTPSVFDFDVLNRNKSLYNTPPTYSIYMCKLYLEWIKAQGGVKEMASRAQIRSKLVYDVVDRSNGFYHCAIVPEARSRMNVVFRIGGPQGDEALEKKFIEGAAKLNMMGVKGHRLVGGIRVSLFNAQTIEAAQKVSKFMVSFWEEHGKK